MYSDLSKDVVNNNTHHPKTKKERQADRQTDRKTERQSGRQAARQTRQKETKIVTETGRTIM